MDNKLIEQLHALSSEDKANLIATLINDLSFPYRTVAESLAFQHPTLQQNFMRLAGEFIRAMGKGGKYYDDRNMASIEFACAVLKDHGALMVFPLI